MKETVEKDGTAEFTIENTERTYYEILKNDNIESSGTLEAPEKGSDFRTTVINVECIAGDVLEIAESDDYKASIVLPGGVKVPR